MRKSTALVAMLALFICSPLVAGSKAYKCDSSAEHCLGMMAKKFKGKGWVGIEYDHNEETGAISVERVIPDSPAYKAKLQKDDVLVAINGAGFTEAEKDARQKATEVWTPGTTVTYTVKRAGHELPVKVVLGEMPKDVMAQWVGNHMLEHHIPVATVAKK